MKKPGLFAISALVAASLILIIFSVTAQAGSKDKAWLGVYMQKVDKELAEAFDLTANSGVLVDDVVEDSPAEKAGIQRGDVIVEFDGITIDDPEELADKVSGKQPGDEVKVTVIRDGDEKVYEVDLAQRPSRELADEKQLNMPWKNPHGWPGKEDFNIFVDEEGAFLGVYTEKLNDQLAEYFDVDGGVLVKQVEEDSPAEEAGIKAGDVIVSVDDDQVDTPSELLDAIRNHEEGDEVEIGIVRRGNEMKLSATLDKTADSWSFNGSGIPPHMFNMPNFPGFDEDFKIFRPNDDKLNDKMETMRQQLDDLQKEMKELKEKLK